MSKIHVARKFRVVPGFVGLRPLDGEHPCRQFAKMFFGQPFAHERRGLRRFNRGEGTLICDRIKRACLVHGLSPTPPVRFRFLAESTVAADFVVEEPLEKRQQRQGWGVADERCYRCGMSAACVAGGKHTIAPILRERANRTQVFFTEAPVAAFSANVLRGRGVPLTR